MIDALWMWEISVAESVLAERIEMVGKGHKHIKAM